MGDALHLEAGGDHQSVQNSVANAYLEKMGVLTLRGAAEPCPIDVPTFCAPLSPPHGQAPPSTLVQTVERSVLSTIETLVFSMDNITTVQALFPRVLTYKPLRPLAWGVQQVNKLYLLYLALQLRKAMARHQLLRRLQRLMAEEWKLLNNYTPDLRAQSQAQLKGWITAVGNQLWALRLSICSYLVDLVLNVGLVLRKAGPHMRALGALSYVLGLFRGPDMSQNDDDILLANLQSRYAVS